MDRVTASEPGHTTKFVRPAVKRWSSAPVASPSSATIFPDLDTALTPAADKMHEDLLMSFIRAYSHFGASLNALEDLMLDASRAFDIKVTVVRRHGAITCLIGERAGSRRYMRVVSPILPQSCFLGLLEVRRTYDAVVEHRIRVPQARAQLANLCAKTPLRYPLAHLVFGALLSGWVCLAVFGGMFSEVLSTVVGALVVGLAHYFLRQITTYTPDLMELAVTITISLLAHSTHTSYVLISVLPGYLYTCAALKRVNKFALTEYIVAIFATTYTLALAFGLPIILDLFLMTKLLTLVFLLMKMWNAPARPMMLVRDGNLKKSLV